MWHMYIYILFKKIIKLTNEIFLKGDLSELFITRT